MSSTKGKVPAYLSRKLVVTSMFAMICVTFIHSYNYTDTYLRPFTRITEGLHIGAMIQFFISNGITRFVIPLFFVISGYLLFAGLQKLDVNAYLGILSKRAVTLAVPYVFWVFFWTAAGHIIASFVGLDYFSVIEEKLTNFSDDVLGCFLNTPLAFQFWYIKDLCLLVLLSPVFWFLAKKLNGYALLLFVIPWLMNYSVTGLPGAESMMFFMLGCLIAVTGWDKKYLSASYWKGFYKLVPLIWIAACAAYTYLSASEAALSLPDIALQLCYMICQLLGLASVFILYDALPSAAQNCRLFTKISSASFMIFCIHEPIQHMAYEYALDINSSNLMHMLLYFALPIFFIIISVGLNELLIRKAPGLKRFLTGNR